VVEPWTNYNVLVFDQRFGDNSSVTLVNTNTTRSGDFRDANATGLLWNIANKEYLQLLRELQRKLGDER
jgi:hypothetical protein